MEGQQQKKINLIIDEYNSEQLNAKEAKDLQEIIYHGYAKIFEDAVIMLVPQSMKKKRSKDGFIVDSNRFDLLEQMVNKELTLVMRNSVEIFKLLEVTQKFLKDKTTSYQVSKKKVPEIENNESEREPERDTDPVDQTESFTACVLSQNRETSSEASVEIPRAHDLGLDEAINYAGLPFSYGLPSGLPLSSGNGSILKSNFEYDIATDTGHKANCELPRLFELHNCKEKFQKILALSVILETINIAKSNANNKHVILHFKQNDEILKRAFDLLEEKCNKQQIYLDVQNKTTEKYKDFQDDNLGKYIFLGYFRTFRGLEHPSVRPVIDPDIGALRHYLIECIARCTTQLNIVLLGSNEQLTELTAQWKYRTENE